MQYTDQSPFCQSQAKYLHMSSSPDLTPASEASSTSPIWIYPLLFHTGCNLGIVFVGGNPQRVPTAAACRICGFKSGVWFRRQERALEGHAWGRCSLGTHEPDHRPAYCNVRQSAPSRSPLRAIHDDLWCKAGMRLGSCPVLPSDGLYYGSRQS